MVHAVARVMDHERLSSPDTVQFLAPDLMEIPFDANVSQLPY